MRRSLHTEANSIEDARERGGSRGRVTETHVHTHTHRHTCIHMCGGIINAKGSERSKRMKRATRKTVDQHEEGEVMRGGEGGSHFKTLQSDISRIGQMQ